MSAALQGFFSTEAGLAVYGVIVVALADFVLGTFAAFRDGTFELDAVAAWVRKHLAGRVGPIAALLIIGHFGAQPLLLAVGAAAGLAYTAETIGSIADSWGPNRAAKQPVPKELEETSSGDFALECGPERRR